MLRGCLHRTHSSFEMLEQTPLTLILDACHLGSQELGFGHGGCAAAPGLARLVLIRVAISNTSQPQ